MAVPARQHGLQAGRGELEVVTGWPVELYRRWTGGQLFTPGGSATGLAVGAVEHRDTNVAEHRVVEPGHLLVGVLKVTGRKEDGMLMLARTASTNRTVAGSWPYCGESQGSQADAFAREGEFDGDLVEVVRVGVASMPIVPIAGLGVWVGVDVVPRQRRQPTRRAGPSAGGVDLGPVLGGDVWLSAVPQAAVEVADLGSGMGGDLLAGEAAFEVGGGPAELRGEQLVTPTDGYQALNTAAGALGARWLRGARLAALRANSRVC